jgi:tRNA(fMet)-specific endonuclease VapC
LARLILDTSVLIDAERSVDPEGLLERGDDLAVAAITIAELLLGVELADGSRRDRRERFVAEVLEAVPVELYDLRVARAHAALMAETRRQGRPRGDHDLIVAATARAHGRAVVTRDRRGFENLPKVTVSDR